MHILQVAVAYWLAGVRGLRFESRHGRFCLSQQPLRYTALGTGCAPVLQYLGRPSMDGNMDVDVDGSCQFLADSQPVS